MPSRTLPAWFAAAVRAVRTRQVLTCAALLSALAAGCSSAPQPEPETLEGDERATVCVGTSAAHAAGDTAALEMRSRGAVLATAELEVRGELVLTIPGSAPEPRLLLDGEESASSPRGGGRGISQGDGCPLR